MRVLRLLELVAVVAVLALVSGVLPKAQETDAAGRDLFCGPLRARAVGGQVVDLTVANNSDKDGDVTLRIFRGNDNNVEEADFDLDDDGDAASITDDVGETGFYYGRISSSVTVSGVLSVRQDDTTIASVPCYTRGETGLITCGPFRVADDLRVRVMAMGTSSRSGDVRLRIFRDDNEVEDDNRNLDGFDAEGSETVNDSNSTDEFWASADADVSALVVFQVDNLEGNASSAVPCRKKT